MIIFACDLNDWIENGPDKTIFVTSSLNSALNTLGFSESSGKSVSFTTASTSDNAFCILVPKSYSIWRTARFSEEVDFTFFTPDNGLKSGTSFWTIFLSTSSADAPGQIVEITMISISKSGKSCLFNLSNDKSPKTIRNTINKFAAVLCLAKKLNIEKLFILTS